MKPIGILFVLTIMGLLALFVGCSSDKMDPIIGPVIPDTIIDTTVISRVDTMIDTITVILIDTVIKTIYDTTVNYDTTIVTEYDTTTLYDTTFIPLVDTVEILRDIHHFHYDTTYIAKYDTVYDTTTIETPPDTVTITSYDTTYIYNTDTLYLPDRWVIMCCGDGPDGKCECNSWTEDGLGPRAVPECLIDWHLREGWHIAYPGDPCLAAWENKWCD